MRLTFRGPLRLSVGPFALGLGNRECRFRLQSLSLLPLARGFGFPLGLSSLQSLPGADGNPGKQGRRDSRRSGKGQLVAANRLLQSVGGTGWTSDDRFVVQVALDVHSQTVRRLISAGPV